jgi:hypothetical protein
MFHLEQESSLIACSPRPLTAVGKSANEIARGSLNTNGSVLASAP